MKILLIVTTLWNGEPILKGRYEMPSMESCEKMATEFRRRAPNVSHVTCLEVSALAVG
jgi:hypothetical protein